MMETNAQQDKPKTGFLSRLWFLIKFLEIRLRFILMLLITALTVGYWDHIQNHYQKWQRERLIAQGKLPAESQAAESDFEYVCGMHPFVIRATQGKCPICGMDLTRRRKGESIELPEGALARVQVSPDRIAQAGVKVEPVAYHLLFNTVRGYGIVEPAESKISRIVARFPGRVDELKVNAVGLEVRQGDVLARIYSPKYLAATQEFIQAMEVQKRTEADPQADAGRKSRAAQLTAYARERLRLAGFTEEQLDQLAAGGKPEDRITLHAPLGGIVIEKNILLGDTVEEGTAIYTIADLSTLWVQVLTPEGELDAIKIGMPVEVTSVAEPGHIYHGNVDFIYPTLNTANRSVKVRVVVNNADGRLKPGMSVNAAMRSVVGGYEAVKNDNSNEKKGKESQSLELSSSHQHGTGEQAPGRVSKIKLPTDNQADADAWLASLPMGSTYFGCCPGCPEVVSDKGGECPKCGMQMVERTKSADGGGVTKSTPTEQAGGDSAPIAAGEIKLPTEDQASADRFLKSLRAGAAYFECPMHPEVVSDKAETCPKCNMKLEPRAKAAPVEESPSRLVSLTQEVATGYACPMHPDELSDKGGICRVCDCGMDMQKLTLRRVPAVPEDAVIDTGTRKIIYVEYTPGVYDARAITLGRRAGSFYPIIAGLRPGEKIVTRGSFLIDAEARLNPVATRNEAAPQDSAAAPAAHQH